MKKFFSLLLVIICLFSCISVFAEEYCPHENLSDGDIFKRPVFNDTETHIIYSCYDVCCADCGEYLYTNYFDGPTENHTFDSNGMCTECGYTENCTHPDPILDYSLQFAQYYDYQQHYYPLLYRYYCLSCGYLWWEVQPGETKYEPHTFDETGTCTMCWYNKEYDKLAPNPNILPDNPVAKKGMVQVGSSVITPIRLEIRKLDTADSRHDSYAGPGREYESTGGYQPRKIRDAYGWFMEGDYVLTDISYATLKRSMVYLKKSAFTSTNGIPVIDISENAHPGTVTVEAVPSMFPQKNRRLFSEQDAKLAAGTEITVYFEKDGWYYCEFTCTDKKPARGWLPKDSVQTSFAQ